MKSVLSLCLFFFALTRFADAHPQSIPTLDYVAGSDAVYLVKVSSAQVHQDGAHIGNITFSVTEVMRGQSRPSLTLTAYEDYDFKENTEWIIFHHPGGFKDCVGWAMEGDCEWLPLRITRDGDKVTAQWVGPLDQVREYLRQHPHQP
jgi:hypothetical protein